MVAPVDPTAIEMQTGDGPIWVVAWEPAEADQG
jgi:hypothetical protein